jgi:hypothetical protein
MATVLDFKVRKPQTITKLTCSKCGAAGQGSCSCGAPYLPAGERAGQAVAAHPEKSDSAIAAEIGVNRATVTRARKKTTRANAHVARTGRDGRKRKPPRRRKPKLIEVKASAAEDRDFFYREFREHAEQAMHIARFNAPRPADPDAIALARQVATTWADLAHYMEGTDDA